MALFVPNRIVLICRGRYEEHVCDVACSPGHLLQINSTTGVQVHGTKGGTPGVLAFAEEDSLQGKTINDAYVATNPVRVRYPAKGDVILGRLTSGQSVNFGAPLMSNGDGTLTAVIFAAPLLNNVADSAPLSALAAETTFSNGTLVIPANTLVVGDVIHIRGTAIVTAQNGADTNTIQIKIGTTVIATSGALNLAANSVVEWDLYITVRTIGASGTIVAEGTIGGGVPGTATAKEVVLTSTAIDTTAAQTITVTDTQSANSAGNSTKLSQLLIENNRNTGIAGLVTAKDTLNNSAGLTPFIRVLC